MSISDSEKLKMIDDPNSGSWVMLYVSRPLEQRLTQMAAAHQQSVDDLAAQLLEKAVSKWEALTETRWIVPLLESDDGSGDTILEIPDELLAATGWAEGDTISLEDRGNGALLLRKVNREDVR